MSFRATVPLCTCGVLFASPASVPRGSSSSVQPSSPAHGGPTPFSPWGERCRGVAASDRSEGRLCLSFGVLYEPPVVSAAYPHLRSSCACWGRHHHHHGLASCLRNRLHHLYLGRRPPVHRSHHQYQHRRQLLAFSRLAPAGASCTTRGLPGYSGPVCQPIKQGDLHLTFVR